MKTKLERLVVSVLALLLWPLTCASAQDSQTVTIDLLTTYDYPLARDLLTTSDPLTRVISTTGAHINDRGLIAGHFDRDPSARTAGFIRFPDGSFSPPIVEPDDAGETAASEINNNGDVCGHFLSAVDGLEHGFILSRSIFTQFDVGPSLSTYVMGNNDAGDLAGYFTGGEQALQGFVRVGGTTTMVEIPGAILSSAEGINNSGMVVGFYDDSNFVTHGFLLDTSTGTLTYPFDFSGATATFPEDINDRNEVVGSYKDSNGLQRGFYVKLPRTFASYAFPEATGTSLNGINNHHLISGRYSDSVGTRHGIVAKVEPDVDQK